MNNGFSNAVDITYSDQLNTTQERLNALLNVLSRYRIREATQCKLKKLAEMSPVVRLSVNLKALIEQLCNKDIENVLVDGLTTDERLILLEIDMSTLPIECKETAHALLHVPTRMKFIRVFGKLFKTLRTKPNHKTENSHG